LQRDRSATGDGFRVQVLVLLDRVEVDIDADTPEPIPVLDDETVLESASGIQDAVPPVVRGGLQPPVHEGPFLDARPGKPRVDPKHHRQLP
jgi:hypothetical protein